MSQRLLDANQRRLDDAATALDRVRAWQDRAVLLCRLGRLDDADAAIRSAHAAASAEPPTEPPTEPRAELPAELRLRFDFVQSIRSYFAKHFGEALAAMRAAHDSARLACAPALAAECESALALFSQREGDVRAAVRHARAVLDAAEASPEARYRAYLALASLHQDAYEYEEASRLYQEAEVLVRALDDDIAMASWLQRAALTQASHARQAAALGELDGPTLKAAVAALEKSIDFAQRTASGSATRLDQLMLAEMMVLQKRHREALALYDTHLRSVEGEGFMHEVTAAQADRARCRMELGELDAGYADLLAALRRVDESTPADIRAIVHDNMVSALERLGHGAEAEQHRLLARMAWDTFGHEQREARRLLRGDPPATLH